MARTLDELPPRAALCEIARDFHARGWMHGTAGNLSAREDDGHFWITASALPKGRLDEDDFLLVRIRDGEVVERARGGNKPSVETVIHRAIYELDGSARAVLHGHSVAACLAADRVARRSRTLRLPAIEMIKGLGVWERNPQVDLALFENHLDVSRIAKDMRARFRTTPPVVTALLVRGHGPTVWGRSLQEAYDRFECLEFLLDYAARRRAR